MGREPGNGALLLRGSKAGVRETGSMGVVSSGLWLHT